MNDKPTYAVGLDLGSRKTRMVICLFENNRIRFLGSGQAEGQGWIRGRISDQNAVAESALTALRKAEADAQVSVDSAVVGMGGQTVRGANGRGVVELGHVREIEQRDVARVVERAGKVQLQEDRMILQLYPQDFVVDGYPGHRDPRRMLASCLEFNVHLVTGSIQEHNSLVGAVNQAHLAVEETVFEGQAACYASVKPEERREGIALVDIGAESTDVVVYYGDSIQLASTVRLCGDHFSRDLAQGLCLSFEDAEAVKLEYGSAAAEACADNVFVELPTHDNREPRQTRLKTVRTILESRAKDLFTLVRTELARVNMDRALIGGVFLTGGGANLPYLCDVAENELQCQTRFGLPVGIRDWPDELNRPEWTVAAGLAMYSAKIKQKTEDARESAGWLAKFLSK